MKYQANKGSEQILFGKDSIVIQKYNSGLAGGRTLNTEDFPLSVIPAGTVIIKQTVGSDIQYSPMPVVANESATTDLKYNYGTLPSGAAYAGMLYRSIAKNDGQASIMIDGVVNEEVLPIALGNIKSAFLAAVSQIILVKDEIA